MSKRARMALLAVSVAALLVCAAAGAWGYRQYQATPAYQFRTARLKWDTRPFRHYRMAANYRTNWAQCYYDIEVRDAKIRHVYSVTCLSATSTQTLTIETIFENFGKYVEKRICAATGCYCDGTYALRATYHADYGYPEWITTRFVRNWLDDLLHGQLNKQSCRRADVTFERIEVVKLEPVP